MIKSFMKVYMYELELFLNKQKDIIDINFQSDEANIDRSIKEYLKNIIENKFNSIFDTKITKLDSNNIITLQKDLKKIKINRVLLPEEISEEIKLKIKDNKQSIYTNPDICFQIYFNKSIFYETVEIKSTKIDKIPGSSIKQINPNEWVIFIKHNKNLIEIITGKYINSISEKMQFPDRSPRPEVSFNQLKNWNKVNRIIKDETLIYKADENVESKYQLLNNWQSILVDRWLEILFDKKKIKKNEPWFNNTLRIFILNFLDKYENYSFKEKQNFKAINKKLIRKI